MDHLPSFQRAGRDSLFVNVRSPALTPSNQPSSGYQDILAIGQTTHLHPTPRLRMLAGVPPLSQYFVCVRLATDRQTQVYEIRVKK
jgi:hypothetical protein